MIIKSALLTDKREQLIESLPVTKFASGEIRVKVEFLVKTADTGYSCITRILDRPGILENGYSAGVIITGSLYISI